MLMSNIMLPSRSSSNNPPIPLGTHLITPTGVGTGMSPGNKSPNPPAPSTGAGANQEGEGQGSVNTPLPPYVIPPQELKLLGWIKEAKSGDRLDLTSLLPPPPPPGAVEITSSTKFFNIRTRYVKEKSTLVILSGGFALTANPLRGIRIYKDKALLRELNDCWSTKLWTLVNKVFTTYGYNTFTEKWQTVSGPDNDHNVRKLIALIASVIRGRERELKDPMFAECINPNNSSSKTPS